MSRSLSTELRRAIGSLLCVGIPGVALDAATEGILRRLQVGTVILFRRNVGTLEELTELCRALHALPSEPWIAIDHEGGRVLRLGDPFTRFPAAAAVGRDGRSETAYAVGRAMALELRSVGIHLSFAPVLDVNSNPANPVIGDRAFGATPGLVSDLGIAQMHGLLDGGVMACGKHFPGHGDTSTDSHFDLPVVSRSRPQLDAIELPPFRAAIAAGIPMLLTAHVVYPELDAERPATLSPSIVNGVLRGELGFDGVVASDDLDMRAISDRYPIEDVAVGALQAGVDMLLLCNDMAKAEAASLAIEQAIVDGRLATSIVETAARRVARLRLQLPPSAGTCLLPNSEHRALAERLAGG